MDGGVQINKTSCISVLFMTIGTTPARWPSWSRAVEDCVKLIECIPRWGWGRAGFFEQKRPARLMMASAPTPNFSGFHEGFATTPASRATAQGDVCWAFHREHDFIPREHHRRRDRREAGRRRGRGFRDLRYRIRRAFRRRFRGRCSAARSRRSSGSLLHIHGTAGIWIGRRISVIDMTQGNRVTPANGTPSASPPSPPAGPPATLTYRRTHRAGAAAPGSTVVRKA